MTLLGSVIDSNQTANRSQRRNPEFPDPSFRFPGSHGCLVGPASWTFVRLITTPSPSESGNRLKREDHAYGQSSLSSIRPSPSESLTIGISFLPSFPSSSFPGSHDYFYTGLFGQSSSLSDTPSPSESGSQPFPIIRRFGRWSFVVCYAIAVTGCERLVFHLLFRFRTTFVGLAKRRLTSGQIVIFICDSIPVAINHFSGSGQPLLEFDAFDIGTFIILSGYRRCRDQSFFRFRTTIVRFGAFDIQDICHPYQGFHRRRYPSFFWFRTTLVGFDAFFSGHLVILICYTIAVAIYDFSSGQPPTDLILVGQDDRRTSAMPSLSRSGHRDLIVPAKSGQWSSLSVIPSLSASGGGIPLYSRVPFSLGHFIISIGYHRAIRIRRDNLVTSWLHCRFQGTDHLYRLHRPDQYPDSH